jgi:hypothetical protein
MIHSNTLLNTYQIRWYVLVCIVVCMCMYQGLYLACISLFLIYFMMINTNTCDDTYHNTYQYCRQYLPIHDLIHTNTAHNTYQYLPNYIPILSTIHTNTYQITYQYYQQYIPIPTNQYIPIRIEFFQYVPIRHPPTPHPSLRHSVILEWPE